MRTRAKAGGGEGCSGMTYKIGQVRSRAKVRTSEGGTEEETRSRATYTSRQGTLQPRRGGRIPTTMQP